MQGFKYLFILYLCLALGIFGFTYKAIFAASIGLNVFYIGWMIIHYVRGAIDEARNPEDLGNKLRRMMRAEAKKRRKKKKK